MQTIPLYKLTTTNISRIYQTGKWIDGSCMHALEDRLQLYLGSKYVILTSSGTAALLASYWAMKKFHNTLYVDPYTFPATYQPARLLNYEVHFQKYLLASSIHLPRSGLCALAHLFGQPNQLILECQENDVIEDACQSFGAEINGKKVGTFGKIGCYSFYPTKSLHTCGHGGAIVTDDEQLYWHMKVFVESGRKNGVMTESVALNLRMDEVKAEFLLQELDQYDQRISRQREIAKEFLSVIPIFQPFLLEKPKDRHLYSVFNLLIDKRDDFRTFMTDKGIETSIYYGSDMLPKDQLHKYESVVSRIVCIPCRWSLTVKEVSRIKSALTEWFS